MNSTQTVRPDRQREQGEAVIALLFALSIFSVLSLTVLKHAALEEVLRTSDRPDLHLVLFAGGAGGSQIVGRLNLPTAWREESVTDPSTEVRAPGGSVAELGTELQPGWAYAVQLTENVRVCCDTGDGACANVPAEEIQQGAVSPTIDSLQTIGEERNLRFSLSSAEIADNVVLDPAAVVESPFLIKASRIADGEPLPEVAGADLSCRLEAGDRRLADGVVRLQPGIDHVGQMNRVSAGNVELKYQAPRK